MTKIIKIKCLIITYLYLFVVPCSAQDVEFKDGVSVGKRSEFISSCIKGVDRKKINISGVEVETYKYCACVSDNLIPTINSWEMEKAIKENTITDLFLNDKNLKVIMKCFESSTLINDDFKFEYSENPELQQKIGVKNCVNEIMSDSEINEIWTKQSAEEYCDCAISKLLSVGYTYKDFMEIEDENSPIFNEIALPCIANGLKTTKGFKSINSYNVKDINGESDRTLIPLTDYYGNGYKIKITISGIAKYYLFDTGASDLVIDRDVERELLLNGALKREDYLNKSEYKLANNQIVKAQLVKVDNINIGDYTVNNVVIAIIDEGALLCGKSFLDKFKKWEVDKEAKVLTLYK